jgi:hypothetical protein
VLHGRNTDTKYGTRNRITAREGNGCPSTRQALPENIGATADETCTSWSNPRSIRAGCAGGGRSKEESEPGRSARNARLLFACRAVCTPTRAAPPAALQSSGSTSVTHTRYTGHPPAVPEKAQVRRGRLHPAVCQTTQGNVTSCQAGRGSRRRTVWARMAAGSLRTRERAIFTVVSFDYVSIGLHLLPARQKNFDEILLIKPCTTLLVRTIPGRLYKYISIFMLSIMHGLQEEQHKHGQGEREGEHKGKSDKKITGLSVMSSSNFVFVRSLMYVR